MIKLYNNTVISNKCLFVKTYYQRPAPSRNLSYDPHRKSIDWFLYGTNLHQKALPNIIMINSFVI